MEIKKISFVTFKLSYDQVDLLTDPLLSAEMVKSFPKTPADIVIHSESKYIGVQKPVLEAEFKKLEPKSRESIMEISSPGQYEVGGVMLRRSIKQNFYVLDDDNLRVVYMGGINKNISTDKLGNLGDVDILILPIGDNDLYPSYEKLEQIIKKADPTYLIPCAYKEEGLAAGTPELRSLDDFIKHFGFTHVSNEKKFKVVSGVEQENKMMEIVILE